MATFVQLYGDRLDRELGSADRTKLFTTARRKTAVNEAQQEFAKQTECFTKEVSVPVVSGTREYDLDAAGIISAEDFAMLAAQGVEYALTDAHGNVTVLGGELFERRDIPRLNAEEPGWRSVAAVSLPSGFYVREDGGSCVLGLHQPPLLAVGETASLRVPYVAIPPDMVADDHEPFSVVPGTSPKKALRLWHQALVHYAAALLEPLRKNYPAEERQRTLFAGQVADYLQRKRPRGGRTVTLARNPYRDARRGGARGARFDPRVYP